MHDARILGVLGGMGPLASVEFMRQLTLLTPATRDQDHIPTILWSDPRVPDRTAAHLFGGEDPLPWLQEGLQGLEQAGCGAVAIPCNTAHGWHESLAAATNLHIIHIVDAAALQLRRRKLFTGTIAIMGTAGTLAMGLYQERLNALGYDCIVPHRNMMSALITPAITMIKSGRLSGAKNLLMSAACTLAREGADAIVLGCTEIPLAITHDDESAITAPIIDTIEALAIASIEWARPPALVISPSSTDASSPTKTRMA